MSIISPTNKSPKNGTAKKRLLLILALFIIFLNLIFFIWLFTGEKKSYYNDQDEDGFGNLAEIKKSKIKPWGYVSNHDDTDDNDPCIPDSLGVACKAFNTPKTKAAPPLGPQPTGDVTGDNTTIEQPIKKVEEGEPKKVEPNDENKDFDKDTVADDSDSCPNRKGPPSNKGCPEYQISLPSEAFVGENFDVKIVDGILEPGDKVNWITDSNIKKITSARELEAMGQIVGMYKISAELSNSDGFEMSLPNKTIFLKIRPDVLAAFFKPFYVYGSALSSKTPNVNVLKNNADVAKVDLKKHIKDGILSGANVYDNTGGIVNDLETFISADIIGGAVKGGLKVSKVKYSTKTGKITEIHLQ